MNQTQHLAKKYAIAWLSLYMKDLHFDQLSSLRKAVTFLQENERTFFFLNLSVIDKSVKRDAFNKIIKAFGLPKSLDGLIDLLLEHKRSYLFSSVLKEINNEYQKKNKIQSFVFLSPQELSDDTCKTIERFLAYKTECAIIYEKRIDKRLIAGIRLLSTTLLWEYSLAQQLRTMQNALMQ